MLTRTNSLVTLAPMDLKSKREWDHYSRVAAAVHGSLVHSPKYRDKSPLAALEARRHALDAVRAARNGKRK